MSAEFGNLKIGLGVDTSGLKSGLKSATSQINQFGNAIKGIAFAQLASQAGKFAEQLSNIEVESRNVRKSFDRFKNSIFLLEQLKTATGGATSELNLMKQSIRATNLGVSQNDLAKYFEFATIRAAETGESVDYLITSIVNGVGRRSPLILDNLGIGVSKLGSDFRSAGDAAERVAKIIDEELVKSVLTIEDAVKPTARLAAAWDNLVEEIADTAGGEAGSAISDLAKVLEFLEKQFQETDDFARQFIAGLGDLSDSKDVEDAIFTTSNLLKDYKRNLKEAKDGLDFFEESEKSGAKTGLVYSGVQDKKAQKLEEAQNQVNKIQAEVDKYTVALKLLQSELAKTIQQEEDDIRALWEKEYAIRMMTLAYKDAIKAMQWEQEDKMAEGIAELYEFAGSFGEEGITPINEVIGLTEDDWIKDGERQIEGGASRLKDKLEKASSQVGQAVQSMVMESLVNLGSSIGEALSGEYNFGDGILRSLGSFVEAFGRLLITFGIGKDAFEKLAEKIGTGPLIVAAGVAAVAAGKAIQNSMRGASGALSGGSAKSFAVAASQGDVGGYGRIQEQPDINIYLNGYELTKGLRRQNFFNDRTGG